MYYHPWTFVLTIIFILIAVLLMLVILVQRGRGGGLAGAFGMGGGGGSAFGTKTGDVFTIVTVILFTVFLLGAVGLNYRYKSEKEHPVVAPPPSVEKLESGLPIEGPAAPPATAPAPTPVPPRPPATTTAPAK